MNNRSAGKIQLGSYDDLFGGSGEQVKSVPLEELHTFRNHPFKVLDNEKMEELAESIKQYGVLMPGIARPRLEGGYEIIAGHCRKRGSELAGLKEMPVFVRNYSDDEAVVIMVDTNIQREDLLPSEKARAYRMKFEALRHQGKNTGKHTFDEIGETAGESGKTVQRYIWLSRLNDELLDMVDSKKLGIVQGINISFLSELQQEWVMDIILEQKIKVSNWQSEELKNCSKEGKLTVSVVKQILDKQTENTEKEKMVSKVTIKSDTLTQFFPPEYTEEEIREVILQLLEDWRKQTTN
ncbi:MAG: ParB/RepB/Spo0J family partition protein [Lachnospiraceae bacterium]|nr:ParB/RepB/Spo0J family partition protein [Lachnospiraceae bacterium]MBP3609171.1 ParB/RepB/Spo0J family partition protein [Lachnospiraceae bacterium]